MNIPMITSSELAATEGLEHPPEPKTPPLWPDLVAVEPCLNNLECLAIGLHRKREDIYAWGVIKLALSLLVGWEARKYQLRTATAYDVAYDYLLFCFDTGKRYPFQQDEA
jgi:hypothetical protein